MTLQQLSIHQLRQFNSFSCQLHPKLNIIIGPNGSGKTSLLESIYLLSTARSFRSREHEALIQHKQSQLTIHAILIDQKTISIQKSLTQPTKCYIDSNCCQSSSELSYCLPTQLIYQDMFQIIDAGPAVRRNLLDWGLFHVEPDYLIVMKQYKRVLKQRNALLQQKAASYLFPAWNTMLSDLAQLIDKYRIKYMEELNTAFQKEIVALNLPSCTLGYYNGWDKKHEQITLESILEHNLHIDQQYGYTRYGAHQAELLLKSNGYQLKQYASRGQQKIILLALKIAQAALIKKKCCFLIDDLFAELDMFFIEKALFRINDLEGQFFITAHNLDKFGVAQQHYNLINLI